MLDWNVEANAFTLQKQHNQTLEKCNSRLRAWQNMSRRNGSACRVDVPEEYETL